MLTFVLHAWSSWKNAKAVALLATTALAAGIGSATAIYTVVNTVLLEPVRWQHGERYVSLFGTANIGSSSKWQWMSNSWLDLLDYQQRTHSFDAFGIYAARAFVLTAPGEPQHLEGVEVTPSFAASLGVAPATASVTLAGMSIPARSVGGDYYDFLDLGGGRIGLALADVAGKGVAAALIMSVVQASLRILATEENGSLAALAAKMNRFLHRSTGSNGYATFFYGEIDEGKRRLRYVNAGHNPPCLLRCTADLTIEELPAGGTAIGLFPRSSYEESSVDLEPGDVLVAFTDGVPEALNPQEEEFGEDRLKDMLRRLSHLDVGEMASQIAREMKNWIGTADQYDDLTFILAKVNAKPATMTGSA